MARVLDRALWGLLALAACSSSTTTGNRDAGADVGAVYGGGPEDGGEGGGGSSGDASDGAAPAECTPPLSAMMVTQTEAGPVGCMPNRKAFVGCDLTTMFRLVCTTPNPTEGVPPPPIQGCDLQPNVSEATEFYCCPCGM